MKKTIKAIGINVTMGFMLVCAYLVGTAQAGTVAKVQTMLGTGIIEVATNGYINMNAAEFQDNQDDYADMRKVAGYDVSDDGLQLYFEDGSGYWLER